MLFQEELLSSSLGVVVSGLQCRRRICIRNHLLMQAPWRWQAARAAGARRGKGEALCGVVEMLARRGLRAALRRIVAVPWRRVFLPLLLLLVLVLVLLLLLLRLLGRHWPHCLLRPAVIRWGEAAHVAVVLPRQPLHHKIASAVTIW